MRPSSVNSNFARITSGHFALITRFLLGLFLTDVALSVACKRLVFQWSVKSSLSYLYLGICGVVVVATWIVTYRLLASFHEKLRSPLLLLVCAGWLVIGFAQISRLTAAFIPSNVVCFSYGMGTLWLAWLAWWFSGAFSRRAGIAGLTVLIALCAGFGAVFEVRGTSGSGKVNVVWSWWGLDAITHQSNFTAKPSDENIDDAKLAREPIFAQFRGPNRSATLPDIRLTGNWNMQPPSVLWQREIGSGWGSFAVAGSHAITQEQRGEHECVVCYRLETGEQRWIHADVARFQSNYGGTGPRATPTLVLGNPDFDAAVPLVVVSIGATGILSCLDGSTGQLQWSATVPVDGDVLANQDQEHLFHGFAGSPLVIGRSVVVCPVSKGGPCLAAYDLNSGNQLWTAGSWRASYSSPMVAEVCGQRQIILFHEDGLSGFDIDGGAQRWHFPWANSEHTNVAQPIIHCGRPNRFFVSCGYGQGGALVEVSRDQHDMWDVKELWTSRSLKCQLSSAVYHEGYIYGLDDAILVCVDVTSGQRKWKRGRYGHGQVLLIGDQLLVQTESGDIALVKCQPEALEETARIAALTGKTWNHPVFVGDHLLLRNDHQAMCLQVAIER